MLQVGELAAQISEDLDREDPDSFVTPTKSVGAEPMDDQEPLSEEAFLPLSQKLSLSPLHDEEVSASASELLYSELSDKKSELDQKSKLLEEAHEQVREYKLKCEALASSLSASKKRQREEAQGRLPEAHADAAPRKKPSPEHAPKVPKPVAQKAADVAAPANLSDDEVPPPTPKPVVLDFKFANPYERLQSILCAYKAKQVIPGSDELPFDLCALIVKEEADAVEKWSKRTCSEFHEPVIAALKLVYPNKVDAWFKKPFLCSPTGAAMYWAKVLIRRSEIWSAAAERKAAQSLPPPFQEPLKERIRRKIAERKAARVNSLSVSFRRSASKAPVKTPPPKPTGVGMSSDSDEPSAHVIDLSQSPAASSASAPSCPSSASSASTGSPPKAAPHPK